MVASIAAASAAVAQEGFGKLETALPAGKTPEEIVQAIPRWQADGKCRLCAGKHH